MSNSLHKANFLQFITEVKAFFDNSLNQEKIELFIEKASVENPWFNREQIQYSLATILKNYFNLTEWDQFFNQYPGSISRQKVVGLILPGNIPAVGIHDILMVLASGHQVKIKMSGQDRALIELFLSIVESSALSSQIQKVDKITNVDAIIATGSDQSAQIFHQYFGDLPNIIRGHRSSLAILTDKETADDFHLLAKDIFTYYGLGCRNVSKLFIPEDYNPTPLFDVLTTYQSILDNTKYANNYQYQRTLHVFNGKKHYDLGNILVVEEKDWNEPPIGVINLIRYKNLTEVQEIIFQNQSTIQCIVQKNGESNSINVFDFGQAQEPKLDDFADLINSYEFLLKI